MNIENILKTLCGLFHLFKCTQQVSLGKSDVLSPGVSEHVAGDYELSL